MTKGGYSFSLATNSGQINIVIKSVEEHQTNLVIDVGNVKTYKYFVLKNDILLIALDIRGELFITNAVEDLYRIKENVKRCLVISIKELKENKVSKILVEECLAGPQTPEKAKQASFVSLDVRKKAMGTFDPQSGDGSFVSALVIGEISHWEEKSLSMIRLCNDYNLFVPDEIIIEVFEKFKKQFQLSFQDMMTKNYYKNNVEVKNILEEIIETRKGKVLIDLASNKYVRPQLILNSADPHLTFTEI